MVSTWLGLKGVKIPRNVTKVGVHACLSNIHPKLRIWSKLRLHLEVLLGFGLKMPKIILNIVKVGMQSYLPNVHLNLWLNFNSKKLVKSETPLCSFTKVGVKGGENSSECREIWSACLSIKRASKIYDQISTPRILSKLKLHHSNSLRFGFKEKVQAFRPWFDQVWANLNFEKLLKSETLSCVRFH